MSIAAYAKSFIWLSPELNEPTKLDRKPHGWVDASLGVVVVSRLSKKWGEVDSQKVLLFIFVQLVNQRICQSLI